jgi:hypothetical protein
MTGPILRIVAPSLLLLCWRPAGLVAQSLEQRIAHIEQGTVHLSYPARADVCGDEVHSYTVNRGDGEWEAHCGRQLARVSLEIRNHRVSGVRAYVGGQWRPNSSAVDLGSVRPQEAAAYFLSLAERDNNLTGDPILAATLADSAVIWPALLRLARSTSLDSDTRRSAVFWLSQAAGAAVTPVLDSIAGDPGGEREIRKQAVFALSQRPALEAVPALIRIAKSNPDPEVRKSALFWLGQSEDPRALTLFEEILH